MISSVVHDEHSGSTYWLDNAFGVDDLAARSAIRHRPRQPARGHGQEHVPAEPLLPRLLLPRGVHGRRDGGRARSATRSTRSPTPTATPSARRSTSQSCRSTSGSSTTPLTRPYTQARTLGARGPQLLRHGLDLRRRRSRSCAGYCRSRACWRAPPAPATATALRADRVPGGLQLGDRLDPRERVSDGRLVAGRRRSAWRTRLIVSAASRSSSAASSGSPEASTIAFEIAMRRERRRKLGAAAGQQVDDAARDVGDAEHLGEVEAGAAAATRTGSRRRCCRPPGPVRARRRARAAPGCVGRNDADDASRLRQRERQERRRHRVDPAEHRLELVGPAGVVDEHVDRGIDLPRRRVTAAQLLRVATRAPRPLGTGSGRGCTRCARPTGQPLGGPRRPRRERPCASPRDVDRLLTGDLRAVVAPRLRAHEGPADPQLVRLAETGHPPDSRLTEHPQIRAQPGRAALAAEAGLLVAAERGGRVEVVVGVLPDDARRAARSRPRTPSRPCRSRSRRRARSASCSPSRSPRPESGS